MNWSQNFSNQLRTPREDDEVRNTVRGRWGNERCQTGGEEADE